MDTLLEQVRFNIEWQRRNDSQPFDTDEVINAMTPLELLTAISEALAEMKMENLK